VRLVLALPSTFDSILEEFLPSSAVEILLKNSFKPERTVVMAFGFDEEGGGPRVRVD
jgi:hypothetical protein